MIENKDYYNKLINEKMKIDYRKKSQYIEIDNNKIYVWLYKKENYIAYGINGTSFHKVIDNYKNKNKMEILKEIIENYRNESVK